MKKITTGVAILLFIAFWIFLAGTIGSKLTSAPQWVQLVFYIIAGVAWVLPLKPILAWMNRPDERSAD